MTIKIPSLRAADLSTAHMSPRDDRLLRSLQEDSPHTLRVLQGAIGRVVPHGYGYFVSLHYDVDSYPTQASWARALRLVGFSATFVKVCRECKKAKFVWIYFDRDSDTVDGLPKETW